MAQDSNQLRILIAGGGTGGHVIPALSIARELRDQHNAQVHFVGTERGIETKLVPEAGFPISYVHVGMLKNVSLKTKLMTLTDLPRGVLTCIRLIRQIKPHVVVGVGGYGSGPAMLAALILRKPTLVFEPNAVPGMVNRAVGKYVSAAAVSFQSTLKYFRNAKQTGRPVKPEFFAIQPKRNSPPHLLIMGGSQGARALNQILPQIANGLLRTIPGLTILHQTGERHLDSTLAAYKQHEVDLTRVNVSAFIQDIPAACAAADLILCRSGGTVEELCAAGRPSILVPFPQSADDHQKMNAEAMMLGGASIMLLEDAMTATTLADTLRELFLDSARLHTMAAAARRMAHPNAVQDIGNMITALATESSS